MVLKKNETFAYLFVCGLLNLQMCQILFPDPVYIWYTCQQLKSFRKQKCFKITETVWLVFDLL